MVTDMAKTAKTDSIEKKIEKAQQAVVKAKARYDAAVAELKDLMDKRDAVRKDEIMKAIEKSEKTYDEIMTFIKGLCEE